ncbi:translation initiation factor IF-2-like [Moschus berezovskii]|uniref:translation initiation factor IF-2-like n=1 Tax=Moschus berezovskii TaxID=68408 RepID=UPI002443B50C|nr:translation initiation factor IF-2-like [Moschus berezovskii]
MSLSLSRFCCRAFKDGTAKNNRAPTYLPKVGQPRPATWYNRVFKRFVASGLRTKPNPLLMQMPCEVRGRWRNLLSARALSSFSAYGHAWATKGQMCPAPGLPLGEEGPDSPSQTKAALAQKFGDTPPHPPAMHPSKEAEATFSFVRLSPVALPLSSVSLPLGPGLWLYPLTVPLRTFLTSCPPPAPARSASSCPSLSPAPRGGGSAGGAAGRPRRPGEAGRAAAASGPAAMGPEAARAAAAAQTKARAARRAARRARAPEPASERAAGLRGVGAAGRHPSRARTLAGRRAGRVSPANRASAGGAGGPEVREPRRGCWGDRRSSGYGGWGRLGEPRSARA